MNRNLWIAFCLAPLLAALVSRLSFAQTSEPGSSSAGSQDKEQAKAKAPLIELADLSGKPRRPLELGKDKAAAILFVLHDCPISNAYAPEIQRLAGEFAAKGVQFYLVHVDPNLSAEEAKKHAKDYRYLDKLPVLVDRKHELVRRLQATTAPEAFVVAADGTVLYQGRIDDRYAALGKPRQQVQRRDLRLALTAILAGKKVETPRTKAIGCYIPDLDSK